MERISSSLIETVKEHILKNDAFSGIKTGFSLFDTVTNGFANGQLIIIGGRPAMGKTTFACSLIDNLCIGDDKSCIFYTGQMTARQIAERLIRIHGNVNRYDNNIKKISERIIKAALDVEKANLWVDDGNVATGEDFIESCREIGKQKRINLVIVDDLQLLVSKTESLNRFYMDLKRLAEQLNCPVVAFSKVKRTVDNRINHMPDISDLQDAKAADRYASDI